jgi:ATP-binding cassette subfamily B protein
VTSTRSTTVRGLATLVTATFTLVALTAALLGLGPVLALVGLATVPLTALLAIRRVGAQRRAAAAMAEATGAYTGAVEETVTGIRTVQGMGGEPVMARRAGAASAALRAAALRRERVEASWLSTSLLVPELGITVGVWLGGEQVPAGTLSPGSLPAPGKRSHLCRVRPRPAPCRAAVPRRASPASGAAGTSRASPTRRLQPGYDQ